MSTFKDDLLSNVETFWANSDEPLVPGQYRNVLEADASDVPNFEIEFMREFVTRNRPCLIRNLPEVQQWPIMKYLRSLKAFEDYLITAMDRFPVNLTPNGLADAVTGVGNDREEIFMRPCEKNMSPAQLFENLRDKPPGFVGYLSEQNNNLQERFDHMLKNGLVTSDLSLGELCFGSEPDAVNLWIGDERSISSIHRDFYENLYCVTHGKKIVHLFPPIAQSFLREKDFKQGTYKYNESTRRFTVDIDDKEDKATWATVDPVRDQNRDLERLGLKAEIGPGDVLYIPAMWYHRVSQTETTVAVNFWYNMEFDHKWVYQSFAEACLKGMYFA